VFDAPAETLDEISRVLKIDDAVVRHMATRHIAGSRTSAPRDDAAAAAPASSEPTASEANEPAAAAVSDDEEPEYAGSEAEPVEADVEEEE
jgi:hypothetical protein